MKTILLLASLLTLSCSIFAQNHALYLENKNTEQQILVKENDKIGIITQSDKFSKGRFKVLQDSLLIVDGDTVAISQLKDVKTQIHSAIVVGSVIKIICGAAAIINAVNGLNNRNTDVIVPTSVLFLIAGGGLWIHSLYASHSTDEWKVTVR